MPGRGLGNYEVGESHVGVVVNELEVGHSLYLETRRGYFATSMVTAIRPGNEFSTLNSIYSYELVEETGDNPGNLGGSGEGVPSGPDVSPRSGGRGEVVPGISNRDLLEIIEDNLEKRGDQSHRRKSFTNYLRKV